MSTSFFEFKKQASFFLKEKIKTARLALTDVTPAQLMVEEATNGNPWAPTTVTLRSISKAAFDLDDYSRIIEILHTRLIKFEKKNWRGAYNSLIVLEHLLTHGPESVADEFQCDKDVINQLNGFQFIDDNGFNWGLTVRKKSERVMKLLEEGTLLKEERNNARKLSRGIQGFGSFNQKSTPASAILREKSLPTTLGRCNSDSNNQEDQEKNSSFKMMNSVKKNMMIYQDDDDDIGNNQLIQKSESSSKENMGWNMNGESQSLLELGEDDYSRMGRFKIEDDHPFNSTTEVHGTASLLSARDGILQGC
ncbi:ENTH domain-containing protein C794.11c-like [Vicia villosa]|uniref:ENTH domain-containing protein C794.11c-like n=1 Tax=Vicia villosa TaxID=3911 RepID=UPI00273C9163|nr:ENTH domain-containing protein C794.11c-like [Vicia villosa]